MLKRWFGLVVLVVFLAACGARRAVPAVPAPMGVGGEAEMPQELGVAPRGGAVEANAPAGDFQEDIPSVEERLVVRNASLTLVVEDPVATMNALTQLADNLGGYVVSSELSTMRLPNGGEAPQARVRLRVPAEKFDQALEAIRAQGLRVSAESITGQDVTEEYVDLQARVKNLQAAEEQLQKIMDQATRTEDVLRVYRELTNVRGEIERLQARIRYLQQSAAMSAIDVKLVPDEAAQPLRIGGWEPKGVIKHSFEMLVRTLEGVVTVVLWVLIYLLPVVALLGLLLWPVYRLGRWALRRWRSHQERAADGQ